MLDLCGPSKTMTAWPPGTGRETLAHREMLAGGPDPAEAEGQDGAGEEEEEDEEDTATALVMRRKDQTVAHVWS